MQRQVGIYIHTVLANAAVNLESLLVRVDIELDAGEVAPKRGNWTTSAPIIGTILVAIDKPAVVVACAVEPAVALELRCSEVGAELLGRGPEIIDGILLVWQDGAVRNENVVDTNALARVWQMERMVVNCRCVGVGKGIEIPVGLWNQYECSVSGSWANLHANST